MRKTRRRTYQASHKSDGTPRKRNPCVSASSGKSAPGPGRCGKEEQGARGHPPSSPVTVNTVTPVPASDPVLPPLPSSVSPCSQPQASHRRSRHNHQRTGSRARRKKKYTRTYNPILDAVQSRNHSLLRILLRTAPGLDSLREALEHAVGLKDAAACRILIREGRAPASQGTLSHALSTGSYELARFLAMEGKADVDECVTFFAGRVLALGATWDSVDGRAIEFLLDYKADVNVGNEPVLVRAIRGRRFDVAKRFIRAKADPNLPDLRGNYPLHSAVEQSHEELVAILLNRKADANRPIQSGTRKGGWTPLLLACSIHGIPHVGIVKRLVESDADVNYRMDGPWWGKSNGTMTALMRVFETAVGGGTSDTVEAAKFLFDKSEKSIDDIMCLESQLKINPLDEYQRRNVHSRLHDILNSVLDGPLIEVVYVYFDKHIVCDELKRLLHLSGIGCQDD